MSTIDEHEAVRALLPWYANRTLDADETERVRAHLAHCAACAEELRLLYHVRAVTRERGVAAASPAAEVALDPPAASPAEGPGALWRRAWWLTPRRLRHVVLGQGVALAALSIWLVATSVLAPASYVTLSTPDAVEPARTLLQVIFNDDVTEGRMRAMMLEHGLVFVDGPTPLGAYTLAVAEGSERSATALATELGDAAEIRVATPLP